MSNPQKENGYTGIANEIIDHLVNTPLLGSEYQIIFFIIRKTYGFQKKIDRISLTQFEKATGLSRPTVVKTIKNLLIRNMLVKTPLLEYGINKHWDLWVVKTPLLVKDRRVTSKGRLTETSKDPLTETSKDPLTHNRKKEIKESNTKEIALQGNATEELINLFKPINPSVDRLFANTTQRDAIERLVKKYGNEKVKNMINALPNIITQKYAPVITTPLQLESKLGDLINYVNKEKNNQQRGIKI